MARYTGPNNKQARRVSFSILENGKDIAKRPYGPGQHGKDRKRKPSNYAIQLNEKQKDFEKQDRMTDSLLKRQDKQLKILEQARKKIETANLEEGIAIIEDITYNQGGIIFPGISWPMYLADVLYKNKMYDRCWKYLNYISLTHLDCLPKIKKLQSKICSKEKKYNDAFYFYIMSVVYSYQGSSFKPTMEIIEMKMNKNMSKVKIKTSNEELFQRILNYINNQSSEIEIRDDLRKIIV